MLVRHRKNVLALRGIILHNSNEKNPRFFLVTTVKHGVNDFQAATFRSNDGTSPVCGTPPTTNMEPKNWWFADFHPVPRGLFQVPC